METDDLKIKFAEAKVHIEALNYRPSNEDLLKLYAYYKQATEGDVTGDRPSGFDFKGAAKFDARTAILQVCPPKQL
ncbi:MAG: acyl-CoA-binding protein [Cyclobacteriaceae bacterium]